VRASWLLVAALGCGSSSSSAPPVVRTQVALVPVEVRHDLDLLYVLDDSPSTLEPQIYLKNAFPSFLAELGAVRGLPSLHIGVVSIDLGTQGADDAQPGASIGSGPGSCSGVGKAGKLLTNGTTLVNGTFISDIDNGDGTRSTNYTGTLTNAFAAIASIGSNGCGFEQPLEAMKRALDNNPANVGFLRPEVPLAIIIVTDEDDCSFSHSSLLGTDTATLGPLQSFRCTRFGVLCNEAGATTDEMNNLGAKGACHWNQDSAYLTHEDRYTTFLDGIRPDRRDVFFGAIAGPPTPFTVEQRTPPGGGSAVPALAHSCQYTAGDGSTSVADPAVRIEELTRNVARSRFELVCASDYTAVEIAMARELRGLLGDSCLTRDIAMPADCEVFDQTLTGETEVPPCATDVATDCYRLVADPACTTSQQLRIDVVRSVPAPAGTMVAARCRL
jgi:hypothetical protein